ncbi:hypothetical protein V3C99_012994 [Haemonchus contortus]
MYSCTLAIALFSLSFDISSRCNHRPHPPSSLFPLEQRSIGAKSSSFQAIADSVRNIHAIFKCCRSRLSLWSLVFYDSKVVHASL